MERRLYDASLEGNVEALKTLIQEDPLILDRVAVTWFHETPLHIAALRGHLHFTKALLDQKPKLATGLDSWRRSPLHLASAEGYDDIVQELLSKNHDMCNVRDRDGRIPLHLAVIKGRLEVIKKLIKAQPNSTLETLDHGETILHLSVSCCCFEVLKLLVESVSDVDEFPNSQDSNGNTILHLASILKEKEIVKYLLSRSGVEANKNAMNNNGLTALDVLEHCPRDVKGMEILYFLREVGVRRANELITITTPPPPPPPPPPQEEEVADHQHNDIVGQKKKSKIGKWLKYLRTSHGENWQEETQQTLMLVATVLASMSFQAAINPPGGVWQEDTHQDKSSVCNPTCLTGSSILAYAFRGNFKRFLIFNTSSFLASLSVILLIISEFPLKNKIFMWLLILAMCMAIVFMALAYMFGMIMVADPLPINLYHTFGIALYIWFGIIGIVGLILLVRFLYWLERELPALKKQSGMRKLCEFRLKMQSGMRKLHEFTLKMRSCMKNERRTLGG